jgi:PhzF family phenazine biosynthesis protein
MQVDVFTAVACQGNPLAVVLDGTGLGDEAMQRFAHWTNLSETTFVLPPTDAGRAAGADYRVRIFTPGAELPFAGHPTLGTCHAWLAHGGQPQMTGVVKQECGVGVVTLRKLADNGADRMAFAAPPLTRSTPAASHLASVLAALGLQPVQVLAAQSLNNGPEWLGLLLDSPDTVLALTPDHAALKALGQNVGVAALTHSDASPETTSAGNWLIARSSREARAFNPTGNAMAAQLLHAQAASPAIAEPDLWVRAFVDVLGVPEDPVTGSLNASLAQWLMADGHLPETCRHAYTATQGQALGRDGRVFLSRDASGQVWVGGDVVTCIRGEVTL